jgi:ABC-type dipeptide/oligopeptide/nickel transport system permease subunit
LSYIATMSAQNSSQNVFLKRFKANKGGFIGMGFIVLAFITAIFAYLLAPDGSPNANRMIPEIGSKKPGFSTKILLLKKELPSTNFIKALLYGKADAYQYLPITSFQIKSDTIFFEKLVDEGTAEKAKMAISQTANNPVITQKFYLGTDKFGRDILSRLIIGVRVSFAVGLIAVTISLTIGILLGSLAGYYRGRIDDIIMWLINVVWSIPTLLLVFAITLALGKGFWQVFIAVGLTMWVNVARLVRGQILSIREMEYIQATKALGYSAMRSIFKHILPNIMGPVMVIAASNFASAIVIEAGLSFLGVGVQPPQPSWGLMMKENYNFIITNNPMLALAPGIAIMLLVLAFNLLGNALRDAFNVRGKI